MKRALFLCGGWAGHKPEQIVHLFSTALAAKGFTPVIETSLDILADPARMQDFAVIFPCWTMGALTKEQSAGLRAAVHAGVGLAGVHGGMGDAFRGDLDYEWMVGGHFLGHPHVGDYVVHRRALSSPLTAGLPESFAYHSEQYYMMVDPAIEVLADTVYTYEGRTCTMPVAWVKHWGKGRVFYHALGHDPEEFNKYPFVHDLTVRGLLWAAGEL